MKGPIHIVPILLSLLLTTTGVMSQSSAPAKARKSPIVTQDAYPGLKSPITLVAKDASLSEVLRVLSDRSGMNFVAGEGVNREKITIILNRTPLDEAINLLVRASGLSYEIIGNSVLIAEPNNLKEEVGQSSYVVELKYARAEEVAVMLSDLTKSVKIDKGGNKLICYTSPRVILEIERIVNSIDHPHILVLLETRLIEVSMNNLSQYGVNWADVSKISSGIAYPESPLTDGFKAGNWIQLPVNLNISLDLLLQNGDARMLMDSKLTTTNNREASLHIGEVVPYVIQSYNLSAAGGVNQQIQKENVGVIVNMIPHVNDEDQITLTLEPEVSNIVDWRGPNADIPLVRVRKTKTTVRVENGQTILLAGLLSEDKSVVVRKLPILGQIPIIGLLFQNRKTIIDRKNLIIEVVPRIIKDPAEISRLMREQSDSTARERSAAVQQSAPASSAKAQPVAQPAVKISPEPVETIVIPASSTGSRPGTATPAAPAKEGN